MKRLIALLVLALAGTQAPAAVVVGYYTDFNTGTTAPAAGITANGYTPVQITTMATQSFAGLNMIVINESNNGSPSADLLSRTADLAAFVNAGGAVIVHSRNVTQGAPTDNNWVPGMAGVSLTTSFGSNIDIVTGGTLVTNGPFGTITNTSLDGGNFSDHGFGAAGSLPAGAVNILSNGNPTESTAFGYNFGAGYVYYSTIPLDFYLSGSGNNPPRDNFNNIYYPNVLAFVNAELPAPEPATLAVFGTLALGAFGLRRRKAAPTA